MKNLTIVINTRVDYFLAKDCILSIKKVYKNELCKPFIVLIADGVNPSGLNDFCEFHNVKYIKGERLYLNNKGGAWIKRWLKEGVEIGNDWILRIDPDTRIFKPVPLEYEFNIDVVSPYFPKSKDDDNDLKRLHGSFQLIRLDSAVCILEAGILDDEKYFKSDYQYRYIGTVDNSKKWKYKKILDRSIGINEDLVFSEVCNRLHFKTVDAFEFMNCWWRKEPNKEDLLLDPVAQHPYYKIENIKSKVIGVGLARTGIAALNNALNLLGVDSVYYNNSILNNDDVFECLEFFEGYTDIPMPVIYQEIDNLYPDSKFILTVRNIFDWMESIKFYLTKWKQMQERTNLMLSPEQLEKRINIKKFLSENSIKTYDVNLIDVIEDEKINYLLSAKYNQHCLDVINYFADSPDKLLILDVSENDSFVKLANFLNTSSPQNNIPVKNSKNEVISMINDMEKAIFRAYNRRNLESIIEEVS